MGLSRLCTRQLSPNKDLILNLNLPTSSAYYRLLKKLRRQVGHAIRDFKMIEEGDKVMVCVSGGKDSYTLLDIMLQFKRIAPINFDVVAVNLGPKATGFS